MKSLQAGLAILAFGWIAAGVHPAIATLGVNPDGAGLLALVLAVAVVFARRMRQS